MQYSKAITAHVFDCDGVLLDSNQAKIDALISSLDAVGCPKNFTNWASSEFRKNFGRTRLQHFKIFKKYNGVAGFNLNENSAEAAMNLYSKKVVDLYCVCNIIPESLEYLKKISQHQMIYVVSASNEVELKKILPSRISVISSDNIYGGPISKIDNLNKLLINIPSKHIMFYGDAVQDAKAAIASGVSFIGLSKYSADPHSLKSYCLAEGLSFRNNLNEVSLNE